MTRRFRIKKTLVVATIFAALLALAAGFFFRGKGTVNTAALEIPGCPILGKKDAPIQMVLFEDLRCIGCREFNLEILPFIQTKYIEPGLARFTIVPLAFLPGSKPLGNAVLAVNKIAPSRVASYVHALSQETIEGNTDVVLQQKLMNLAKAIGGIDLLELKSCIVTDCHYSRLDENFELAKKIMGSNFSTPTLYINGTPITTNSLQSIEAKMELLLR